MGGLLDAPLDDPDQSRPEVFQCLGIGIQVRDFPGQRSFVELRLEPGREVVEPERGSQERLEEVQVEAREADPPEALPEVGEIVGHMRCRDREAYRLHEVELLPLGDLQVFRVYLEMAFDGLDESSFQFLERAEPQGVDRGELFGEPLVPENVGDPVGEVVRWLGHEILVLAEKPVRMVIDDRIRRRLQMIAELYEIPGLEAGQASEADAREKAERAVRPCEPHAFASRRERARLRNRATWPWPAR